MGLRSIPFRVEYDLHSTAARMLLTFKNKIIMSMQSHERPLSPHLQIYRWQITMLLSILHRFTGVISGAGLLLLVLWLLLLSSGEAHYRQYQVLFHSLPGRVTAFGFVFALSFHFCNGIRHLFWDLGWGFEPKQYRLSGYLTVIASLLLGFLVIFSVGGGL